MNQIYSKSYEPKIAKNNLQHETDEYIHYVNMHNKSYKLKKSKQLITWDEGSNDK